jgi:hypothetical protein
VNEYDDETLMAYADGELDDARRAQIAADIERDPALARRLAQHRALRARIAGAYASVADESVPDPLRQAARGPRGTVMPFPARGARPDSPRWRAREWAAMAASLVLGGVLGWQLMATRGGDIRTQGGALVASGELAKALDSQLASEQPDDATVRIGLSFKSKDGAYCRSFASSNASAAGLACRGGGRWEILATEEVRASGGGLRQATSPAVMQAIEAHRGGEVLDAAAERSARDAGWK